MAGSMQLSPGVLAEVAAGAAADAGGLDIGLLGDFLPQVAHAVAVGRPLSTRQLVAYRDLGGVAAGRGVALRAVIDLYLSSAWRLWRRLPTVTAAHGDPDAVVVAGEVVLHAVDDAVAALVEGYQLARRAAIRGEESARREVIDDLLSGGAGALGGGGTAGLVRRAAGLGLDLAGPHAVALVRSTDADPRAEFADGTALLGVIERAVQGSKGDAGTLVASKQGRLVVVFAAPDPAATDGVVGALAATLPGVSWQLAVGGRGAGAAGVLASYREAVDTLELAARLRLHAPVVVAADLLVHRLLLRDRVTASELVRGLLVPLNRARGGAQPLLDTLDAYFAAGGNAAETARTLHLSVRAVTYRLDRVAELTGHDPARPAEHLNLQAAVLAARLLDWPSIPLG